MKCWGLLNEEMDKRKYAEFLLNIITEKGDSEVLQNLGYRRSEDN